jgi:hypothetical protein
LVSRLHKLVGYPSLFICVITEGRKKGLVKEKVLLVTPLMFPCFKVTYLISNLLERTYMGLVKEGAI